MDAILLGTDIVGVSVALHLQARGVALHTKMRTGPNRRF
ncbi:hypothetical protein F4827_003879 [Paraburkholderia bannensis]|uniref:FAD-dependent oxidoreductase n=1 Tax=Paraburkholderia bannensis TaxID=765414 RepID=A0A7W9U1E4_9BURK|nr:hypothetical protein [Paraburkholderia bannensis]